MRKWLGAVCSRLLLRDWRRAGWKNTVIHRERMKRSLDRVNKTWTIQADRKETLNVLCYWDFNGYESRSSWLFNIPWRFSRSASWGFKEIEEFIHLSFPLPRPILFKEFSFPIKYFNEIFSTVVLLIIQSVQEKKNDRSRFSSRKWQRNGGRKKKNRLTNLLPSVFPFYLFTIGHVCSGILAHIFKQIQR